MTCGAEKCLTGSYWIPGYAERRVLVEGWAYTTRVDDTYTKDERVQGAFWDQEMQPAQRRGVHRADAGDPGDAADEVRRAVAARRQAGRRAAGGLGTPDGAPVRVRHRTGLPALPAADRQPDPDTDRVPERVAVRLPVAVPERVPEPTSERIPVAEWFAVAVAGRVPDPVARRSPLDAGWVPQSASGRFPLADAVARVHPADSAVQWELLISPR